MADSNIITTELYPMVKEALDKNSKKFIEKNLDELKKLISNKL